MGHERVGSLPKSKRWRDLVEQIAGFNTDDTDVSEIARRTLQNVRLQFRDIQSDPSVQASFEFLLVLSVASRSPDPHSFLSDLGLRLPTGLTPLALAQAVRTWVGPRSTSLEYRELAQAAATDAIANWTSRNRPKQLQLFAFRDARLEVWQEAGTGAGFCELARTYFASLTARYLAYFLDREASSVLTSIDSRDRFGHGIEQHVQDISQHAFETAKITQSFAAGWYNKHAREAIPAQEEIQGFLAFALGKLRDELLREGERQ